MAVLSDKFEPISGKVSRAVFFGAAKFGPPSDANIELKRVTPIGDDHTAIVIDYLRIALRYWLYSAISL